MNSRNKDLLVVASSRCANAKQSNINSTALANGFYLAKISSSNGFETKSFTIKK